MQNQNLNPARGSKQISMEMGLVELLTLLSIVSKNLAKKILLEGESDMGGKRYGNRSPYKKM